VFLDQTRGLNPAGATVRVAAELFRARWVHQAEFWQPRLYLFGLRDSPKMVGKVNDIESCFDQLLKVDAVNISIALERKATAFSLLKDFVSRGWFPLERFKAPYVQG